MRRLLAGDADLAGVAAPCDHCIQPVHGLAGDELHAAKASAATGAKRFIGSAHSTLSRSHGKLYRCTGSCIVRATETCVAGAARRAFRRGTRRAVGTRMRKRLAGVVVVVAAALIVAVRRAGHQRHRRQRRIDRVGRICRLGGGGGGTGGSGGDGDDMSVPTGPVTPRGAPYENASESVHGLKKVLDLKGSYGVALAGGHLLALRFVGRLGLSAHDAAVIEGDDDDPERRDREVRVSLVRRRDLHETGRQRRHRRLHRRHRRRARFDERRAGKRNHVLRRCHEIRPLRFERAAGAQSVDGGLGGADIAGRVSAAFWHLDQCKGIGMGQSNRRHRRIRDGEWLGRYHGESARASGSERKRRHQQRRKSRGQYQLQLVLGRGGVVAHGHLRADGRAGKRTWC